MSSCPETILFLASNSEGLRRVGQELRDIKDGLKRSQHRDGFNLLPCLDVRPRDMQRSLLDESPTIVHFAGSGSEDGGLVFEDEQGNPRPVSGAALAGLFERFADQVSCVVLNGCYSEAQARAIAQHIEYVVGMRREISDAAALEFAVGFYDALGAGRDVPFAYKLGCAAISMLGMSEQWTPILLRQADIQAEVTLPVADTGSVSQPDTLWRVPELPPHFLPRPELLRPLKAQILANVDQSDASQTVVMTGASQRIGVQGMGGIGKSVLAATLAREPEVRDAFPDGVFWLTVGIEPQVLSQQADLAEALGEQRAFKDAAEGKARLRELWGDRRCLLILDDVWRVADAEAFNALGPRCRLLITTRDGELITGLGATEYPLDVLNEAQALELLAAWAGVTMEGLPPEAREVAQECGNLPLALTQCGAMVRDLTPWADVLEALQDSDLEFIEKKFSHYPYPNVFRALQVSAAALEKTNPAAAVRYQELAVFPADEAVPEAVVVRLWQYTGQLKGRDARKILTTLAAKGMLRLEGDRPSRRVSLHDLQQDYLRAVVADVGDLHEALLRAYAEELEAAGDPPASGTPLNLRGAGGDPYAGTGITSWHAGPNDGYFFEHLAFHLVGAGRREALRALLLDYRWIRAKLDATDVNALLADYDGLLDDAALRLTQGALRLSAHVLSREKGQLQSQLYGRLLGQGDERLQDLVRQVEAAKEGMWLRCLTPSLEQPGGPLMWTLSGHTSFISKVAISPDGTKVISASWDDTLRVWELSSGRELRTLTGHTAPVYGAAINLDGTTVVSASDDDTLRVWELSSGRRLRTLSGHTGPVYSVAISPDGTTVVSASGDNTLKVWELSSGRELRTLTGHTNSVNGVVISTDGTTVISASWDSTLRMWELSSGRELRTFTGHTAPVYSVAISPDGTTMVSASQDNTLKVWELSSGQELRTLTGHTSSVHDVAIGPDGTTVVSASGDNTLKVWELSSGQELRTLTGHTTSVDGVVISPDGTTVVSASGDNTLKVWELRSRQELRTPTGHTASVDGVAISPDGTTVVSASGDNTLKVWELSSGQELRTLTGHTSFVYEVAIGPDGTTAVSASEDNTLKVWNLSSGQELGTLTGHTSSVRGVAISPDGATVISASGDNTLKVWELGSGQHLRTLTGHTDSVDGIAISPDGTTVVSASGDNTLKVWELSSGQELRTLTGHATSVNGVAISPDGTTVISTSWDNTLKMWELDSGRYLRTLIGHTDSVLDAAISLDGSRVISTSWNNILRAWELSSGQLIASFEGNGGLLCCAIAPDNVTIVAGEEGGQIHFLRLEDDRDSALA